MSRVRVKICGVRTLEETEAAFELGVDAVGFNFWPRSARYITPDEAGRIISKLPALVSSVGVFVNEDAGKIIEISRGLSLSAVQLHGDESPEFCSELNGLKIIKAFRVSEYFAAEMLSRYDVSAVLLDSHIKGMYGGTGERFDWRVAVEAKKLAVEAKKLAAVILAGGLSIDNVADAIRIVRPTAVDVCSGVESEPGRKDIEKMRRFMEAVGYANSVLGNQDTAEAF
jgi:phosphoribosylanthranilate isomerase